MLFGISLRLLDLCEDILGSGMPDRGFGFRLWFNVRFSVSKGCLKLPNPTFLQVLIIIPNMEIMGTLPKSRFW